MQHANGEHDDTDALLDLYPREVLLATLNCWTGRNGAAGCGSDARHSKLALMTHPATRSAASAKQCQLAVFVQCSSYGFSPSNCGYSIVKT